MTISEHDTVSDERVTHRTSGGVAAVSSFEPLTAEVREPPQAEVRPIGRAVWFWIGLGTVGLVAVVVIALASTPDLDSGDAASERGDYAAALREWRPLAEQGDAKAQFDLGLMYKYGLGVERDYGEAVRWFRLAAGQGEVEAQRSLSIAYEKGQGVRRNYVEAYKWDRVAAAHGTERTITRRETLAARMSSAQIAEAERRARAWTPKADDAGSIAPSGNAAAPASAPMTPPPEIVQKAPTVAPGFAAQPHAAPVSAGWRVQLMSLRSQENAETAWTKLQQAHRDLLNGLTLHLQRAKLANGMFYRVQAGPLADRASAASLCNSLIARNLNCLIVAP